MQRHIERKQTLYILDKTVVCVLKYEHSEKVVLGQQNIYYEDSFKQRLTFDEVFIFLASL